MSIQLSDHFTYKKLLKFTLPSIAMMIFTSIYGVVDGFFVSNFAGDIPFKAVNLIMPFLMIFGTVGFIFGTGGTAIVAHTLGESDREKANRYFSLFVYVTFALGVVFAAIGIIFLRPIAVLLGAEGEILENCIIYGQIILLALPFLVLQFLFQSFFVAAEKPRMGLFVIIAAGVTNMVLDAVLIPLLPQTYRIIGAAIATALSQFVGGAVPLVYFARKNTSLFRLGKTKFELKGIIRACINGSSEFMSNISMSVVGMLYNIQLLKYAGEDGIAAYGVMIQNLTHVSCIRHLIRLCTKRMYRRPFRLIQHLRLNKCLINIFSHLSAESINFPYNMTFGTSANIGVTWHQCNTVHTYRKYDGFHPKSRTGQRSFTSCMTRTYNYNIIIFYYIRHTSSLSKSQADIRNPLSLLAHNQIIQYLHNYQQLLLTHTEFTKDFIYQIIFYRLTNHFSK